MSTDIADRGFGTPGVDFLACGAVPVLTRRIQWFELRERTNAAQHHHAWVVFDHAYLPEQSPALFCARPVG